MRTKLNSRTYPIILAIVILILVFGIGLPTFACTPVWDVYTAISGGTISAPSSGATYPVSTDVTCTISSATDQDHRYVPPSTHTYPYDTLVYTWTATSGTFPYGNTGLSVTWRAPSSPTSSVTITCTISDVATIPPGETGTRNDTNVQRQVTVGPIYSLSVEASPSTIMTGGIANSDHQSTITATVSPVMSGSVGFTIISGGAGHSVAAQLSDSSVALDGNGEAETTLTSSDLVENVTVRATFLSAQDDDVVSQTYSDQQVFEIDPSEVLADGQSTGEVSFTIYQHGTSTPVVGHSISFEIYSILDENETPIESQYWDNYCTITSSPDTTDSNGNATCTLNAGSNRCTVYLKAHDNNVWQP